jgi:hypothetical protein
MDEADQVAPGEAVLQPIGRADDHDGQRSQPVGGAPCPHAVSGATWGARWPYSVRIGRVEELPMKPEPTVWELMKLLEPRLRALMEEERGAQDLRWEVEASLEQAGEDPATALAQLVMVLTQLRVECHLLRDRLGDQPRRGPIPDVRFARPAQVHRGAQEND